MIGLTAAVALALIALLVFGVGVRNSTAEIETIDRAAFLQLVDIQQDRFLQQQLSPKDYHIAVRGRRRVILAYLAAVRRNAGIYAQSLQGAKSPGTATSFIAALRLRALATMLIPYVAFGLDDSLHKINDVWKRYREIETAWHRSRAL